MRRNDPTGIHREDAKGARRLRVLCVFAVIMLFFAVVPTQAQKVVSDSAAAQHVGEVVTVEAVVHDVHVAARRGIVYLNIGGAFPNITFSAHVPDSVAAKIPGLTGLGGKRVRVTGKIWLQDDKWPAITVTDPAQLIPVTTNAP